MKKRPGSYIVFYQGDRILLLHRGSEYKYAWGFFGGGIEEGETPEQAIVREVREELSYELKQGEYEYIGYKNLIGEHNGQPCELDLHMYITKLEDKLKKFIPTEGQGMELINIGDAQMLDIAESGLDLLKFIEEYLKNE